MKSYTKWMISLVVIMLAVTTFVIWVIQERFFDSEEISIQQAIKKVETLYNGQIESFEEKNDTYYMTLIKSNDIYEIQLDSETGNVVQLSKAISDSENQEVIKTKQDIRTQLEKEHKGTIKSISFLKNNGQPIYKVELTENDINKTLTIDAMTGKVLSENVKNSSDVPTTKTIISKEKAQKLALKQMEGIVTSIVYEETANGGYYLVEVKDDDDRSTFQIHGVSGKILSVTKNYDDDDDDDDDMDDDD